MPASSKTKRPPVKEIEEQAECEDGDDECLEAKEDDSEDEVGEVVEEVVVTPLWQLTECLVYNNDRLDYFG